MDGVDVLEANVHRRGNWPKVILIVVLVGVVLAPISWMLYGWATRMTLLNAMLNSDSYSLKDDPTTRSRVESILPRLIEIHHEAVAECGNAKMTDLSMMDAFNRRIRSWHAILSAMDLTRDPRSIGYVQGFVDSGRALPEETASGKEALDRVRGEGSDVEMKRSK